MAVGGKAANRIEKTARAKKNRIKQDRNHFRFYFYRCILLRYIRRTFYELEIIYFCNCVEWITAQKCERENKPDRDIEVCILKNDEERSTKLKKKKLSLTRVTMKILRRVDDTAAKIASFLAWG